MAKFTPLVLYSCAGATLCALYAPQPIAPVFESELGISGVQAGLFTTAAMFPLALTSIIYGYILEKISIKKILIVALFCLGLSQIAFGLSDEFSLMLNLRGFQGLLIPAILTGAMSYVSQISSKENLASAIGLYIGTTIIGGFLGRFLSGVFTDFFGWRFFIITLGIWLLILPFFVQKFCSDLKASFVKPSLADVSQTLKNPYNFHIYLMIFGVFFAFQAVLNFLPFALRDISGEFSGTKTAITYAGYALGVLVSFNVKKILNLLGGAVNSILFGAVIFILALQILRAGEFWTIFFAMIAFCFGNFIIHSAASGFVAQGTHKGIANGLYVSFYYAGGALGSVLPGFIYLNGGLGAFLSFISLISALSLGAILRLKYVYKE